MLAPLGFPIPLGEEHAVSVSLPMWEDVCDYERGAARVVDAMQIGYPRFFVHKIIQQVLTLTARMVP
jgi:cystathionine gamma-synthase